MACITRSHPADFSICSLPHRAYGESSSRYQLEAVIEIPYAIDASKMSLGEWKAALSLAHVCSLCRIALALLDLLLHCLLAPISNPTVRRCDTHQSSHGAVKSVSMVPSELGVGSLERRVSVRLRLLDTVQRPHVSRYIFNCGREYRSGRSNSQSSEGISR